MRYFDYCRRRLAWKNHISGTLSTASGTDSVPLKETSGDKISNLEICGNTYQFQAKPSANKADPSYFSNSENYSSGGSSGGIYSYYIALPTYLTEKEITVSLKEKSSYMGVQMAVSDATSSDSASVYSVILQSYAVTSTATGSSFKYLIVKSFEESIPAWWESYDLQIEFGSEATEYVPFTVSVATPSPGNPSPIMNSNDSGMSITLKGKNLIDGNLRATPKTQNGVTIQYLPDEDCYLLNGTCTETSYPYSLSHTILVDDYITVSYYYVSGAVTIPSGCYAVFYTGSKNTPDGSTSNWQPTDNFNIGRNTSGSSDTSKKYISQTWFYIEKGITFDNYKVRIMVEKGKVQSPAYEPYFNKTVQIPPSVTLSDGTSIEMNFAKTYDFSDKLIINASNQTVIYRQNNRKRSFTGDENWAYHSIQSSNGAHNVWYYLDDEALQANTDITDHCVGEGFSNIAEFIGSNSDPDIDPLTEGWYFRFQVCNGNRLYFIVPPEAGITTTEAFKSFLRDLSSNGNPLTIQYVILPIEYDLTDTDFAKELLNLVTRRGCDFTIEIEADIKMSSLVCKYYSLENEDKQTITVKCEKTDGTSLCEPCLHEVRKNTLYTVKAPEIDGYVSGKASESADASITTEIKFIYTEAEK